MEPNQTTGSLLFDQFISQDASTRLVLLLVALILPLSSYFISSSLWKSPIPLLNPPGRFDITKKRAKKQFLVSAKSLIENWFKDHKDKPARLIGDVGEVIVLPGSFANEIRNDKRLSFNKWNYRQFHSTVPGFESIHEGFSESGLARTVVTKYLTKRLTELTEPVAAETALALDQMLPNDKEWHTISLIHTIVGIVAHLSSFVFLGTEPSRDPTWLKATSEYAITFVYAADELRMWPTPLRPLVHWFLPCCTRLRASVTEARKMIRSIIEKRGQEKEQAAAAGKKAPQYYDALEWLEQESNGQRYDPEAMQLFFSMAAIHTTSDLIFQVLSRLVQHPEMFKPLREEIVTVIGSAGWKKTNLYNLKLLDSVIKESQRLKPPEMVSMNRVATEDVKLSDGTIISKGTGILVSSQRMWDPEVFDEPEKWDGYRFYNMRQQPGQEHLAQLVSTSPDHLAFGHGLHACPGRFFAANEIKITLVFLIMRYDWQLPKGQQPRILANTLRLFGDPSLQLNMRRRDQEIDI